MIGQISAWLSSPLKQDGSAVQWFLFVGLILVSIYMWRVIGRDWQKIGD